MQSKPITIQVKAPGKLILSGEHAVVYGYPALAMAVNRHVTAVVTSESSQHIRFNLTDLSHDSHFSLDGLRKLKERIKRKYHRFVRGEYGIRQVLQKPFELAQIALGMAADGIKDKTTTPGVNLKVNSTIPVGCGMGSSAATILSVMAAMSHYVGSPMSNDALYQLALEAENMQHGYSSGLDLRVAMQGGCIYMHQGVWEARELPPLSMCLVNTGTPESTTGECVEKVAAIFKNTMIGEQFAAVTKSLDNALQSSSKSAVYAAIRANHRLLIEIGVVPLRIQTFIADIEAMNGVAKICGAGAVTGDRAGIVLIISDDMETVSSICSKAGFEMMPITCEARGVHVV